MRKYILLLIFTVAILNCNADQLLNLIKIDALKAVKYLKQHKEVLLWCGCCQDDLKWIIKVSDVVCVESHVEGLYTVAVISLDNAGNKIYNYLDLAYAHIRINERAYCIAKELGFEADPCTLPFPWKADDLTQLLIKGINKNKKGDYIGALQDYNTYILFDPTHAESYRLRGGTYFEQSDYTKALTDADKAIALDSTFEPAYVLRGAIKNAIFQLKEAIEDLDKAIKINPKNQASFNIRGKAKENIYFNTAKNENPLYQLSDALEDYKLAYAIDSHYRLTLNNMGYCLFLTNSFQEADKYYAKSLLQHNDPQIYYERSFVKHRLKDYKNEIADLNEAIRLEPNNEHFYQRRAEYYESQGDLIKSKEDDKIYRELSAEKFFSYGSQADEKGDYKAAIDSYTACINMNPSFVGQAFFNRGLSKKQMNLAFCSDILKAKELLNDEKVSLFYEKNCK